MKSKFAKYDSLEALQADVNELGPEWTLVDWHPCEETVEDRHPNTGEVVRWPVTFFYARFVEVQVAPKALGGMRAR